jgi:hypothetical protein
VEKIQFLYIEDCPNAETAWKNLKESLILLKINIQPERILIDDDLDADHYSFQGSPSIKVDGVDLWEQKSDEYHMGCRVFPVANGLAGSPTKNMLIERIRELFYLEDKKVY